MDKLLLFEKTMDNLQKLWTDNEELFTESYIKEKGMRSSQLATLVYALIELGVINYNNVGNIRK